LFLQSNQEWYCRSATGASTGLYEQFLVNMTVNQASPAAVISFVFSSSEMELIGEFKILMNTGFVFEENNTDHIVISGIPVNVTESEVSLVRTIIK
jgi:DNA mismatch repair protein MutL